MQTSYPHSNIEIRVKWENNVLIGPDINRLVFSLFPKKRVLVGFKYCPECTKKIIPEQFKNDNSKKEYSLSGLCQPCQDTRFATC